jgi:signal transduction histidine kinase
MTALLAAGGWAAALVAVAAVTVQRLAATRRMALVAQAAHELRGPLHAALLGLHCAAGGGARGDRIAAVELELRRAGLALADLDAAPHGRRARDRAETVDVRALLAESVEAWRPLARELGGDLLFDASGPRLLVHADRLRLAQAVGNLVVNALEHGAGPVRLRLHATTANVRIEIRDSGPGLPAPVPELIAGAPRTTRRGHGLAVAARVAAVHGGRLLTAPVGAGACVVVELPRLDAPAAAPRPRAVLRRGLGRAVTR